MLDQGVWAEVRMGDEHLRLFSEHNCTGGAGICLQCDRKELGRTSEPVDNIEQGKDRAAAHARAYLHNAGHLELPPLEWKKSRSA